MPAKPPPPAPRATRLLAREQRADYRRDSGDDYPFAVRPLDPHQGPGYMIEFPDLPGCTSEGATIEEAIAIGMAAKAAWVALARQTGRPVPSPGEQMSGKWVQRVPKSLHARLAARAQHEGVSLNTLVVALLSEGLGRRKG